MPESLPTCLTREQILQALAELEVGVGRSVGDTENVERVFQLVQRV
ncbi:MAG: hypothetical protein ACK5EA_30210 [Planctomycetaceae bacterium]